MTSMKLLAASAAAFALAAGAASAQTPYGQTQSYGQQTQTQGQTDPIGAILGALFGDRLGVSSSLDSEWNRGRRPLGTQRAQFETRLNADVRSGAISSSAANSLNSEYAELVSLEARYTADGRVTTQERSDLTERYRAFSTRYQAGGQSQGGYDDGYDTWRPLSESRASFDARVNAGVRDRSLTRTQATRLTSDFNALVQLEAGYQRNGIDARERQDLESRWAELSRRVGNDDGGYQTGDDYGSDPRAAQIEARIAAGERNRQISRTEAASLRQELRDLTRRWADLEARVDLRR